MPAPNERAVAEIADHYVDRYAVLDPVGATLEGIADHDTEMTDYSPDGAEERMELDRSTLRALAAVTPATEQERVAAEMMSDRLSTNVALYELGEHLRDLNILDSPVQAIRMVFDQMPTETEHDWETIAARVGLVREGLSSLQAAYDEGKAQGLVAARRQVVGCVAQAEVWAGTGDTRTTPFFQSLVERFDASDISSPGLRGDARRARRRCQRRATRRSPATSSTSTRPPRRTRTRSARSATRCGPACSTAPSSTWRRPTPGVGTSCTASSTRCAPSASASSPASRSVR